MEALGLDKVPEIKITSIHQLMDSQKAKCRKFACTFGERKAQASGTWTDKKELSWDDIKDLLTNHKAGEKDGLCIVPARLSRPERKSECVEEITLVGLDCDCGHTREEIETAIKKHGYAAIIYSTHSHMGATTSVARKEFEKRGLSPEDYLIRIKGYFSEIAAGATVKMENEEEITIEHQPCPRYRVILRPSRPLRRADYKDHDEMADVWRDRIKAVAHHLGLKTDRSCSDLNRLYYLPRHRRGGVFDSSIIDGSDLPIWDLPKVPEESPANELKLEPSRQRIYDGDEDVIGKFNQTITIESLIEKHGYKRVGQKYLAPDSSTGEPGVSIKDGKLRSYHASDPLFTEPKQAHDAFSVHCILEHNGNVREAVKSAAHILGLDKRQYIVPANGSCPPTEWPEGYTQGRPERDGSMDACIVASKNESKEQALCFEDVIKPASVFVAMEIPEKKTYLSPWLNASSIIGITGWRGVGKSLFTEGVVDAVTKAAPFGPWPCENPDNCLIVDGEMAVQDGQKRISDLGTDGRKAELYYYSDAWGHSKGFARASLLSERWRDGLAEYMLKRGIKVWVCDNVASLTPGIDENSKSEWDPINQFLLRLRFSGITTILVHHEGKQGTQRGTSAREDNLDVCISLRKPSDYAADQGARFIVHFTKSRIPLEYLPLIADHEFQLIKTIGDTYEWTWANARKKDKKTILKLMDEGLPQNDIAVQCGVTKGRISQIKTEAIREGLLAKSGRLTQPGYSYVYEDEN